MNRPAAASMVSDATIKIVPVNKIKLWDGNPRKNDKAAPKLAEIFKVRGQISPVVVWPKNNVCYKGNTTIKALMLLKQDTVKVLYVDFPSEAAAVAYGIADNKSSEWSQWDDGLLSDLLNAHEAIDATFATGFTQKELTSFRLSMEKPGALDKADVMGDLPALGDFLVIQFTDTEEMNQFKAYVGMGIQERAINYADLANFLK
jgi:hypothetical protein